MINDVESGAWIWDIQSRSMLFKINIRHNHFWSRIELKEEPEVWAQEEEHAHDRVKKVKEEKEAHRREICDKESAPRVGGSVASRRVNTEKQQVRKTIGVKVGGILKDVFLWLFMTMINEMKDFYSQYGMSLM